MRLICFLAGALACWLVLAGMQRWQPDRAERLLLAPVAATPTPRPYRAHAGAWMWERRGPLDQPPRPVHRQTP